MRIKPLRIIDIVPVDEKVPMFIEDVDPTAGAVKSVRVYPSHSYKVLKVMGGIVEFEASGHPCRLLISETVMDLENP